MRVKGSQAAQNSLKRARTALGLSQQELARTAGITRQTISGIEAGLYSPSVSVALNLARALGRRVDDLFWLEEDLPTVDAVPAADWEMPRSAQRAGPLRVALARVGGRWVAHPLAGDAAFRQDIIPPDALAVWAAPGGRLRARLLHAEDSAEDTVIVAGCSPALSLLARAAERWHPDLRVHWQDANSATALGRLARQEIHVAGVHLWDARDGDSNVSHVRQALPGRRVVLITLGTWEEGLAVRPGNPRKIRGVEDLARRKLSIVNREKGSGARLLLTQELSRAGIPQHAVRGFGRVETSHMAVARAVAQGRADAALTPAAVAAAYGLPFIPLQQVRYDLVLYRESLSLPAVRWLLDALSDRRLQAQLRLLGGYETSRTGAPVAHAS
jgi:putative molybdopterin biosynthesis protein